MKKITIFILFIFFLQAANSAALSKSLTSITDSIPSHLVGSFIDDYGIRYSINDTLWLQHPHVKYHIIRWDTKEQYIIARNDDNNPGEAGLYTRIDYMSFQNMEPWLWGFCLSVYNAKTDSLAASAYQANKQNPKKGCNGFPFSRMKRVD